MATPRARPTRMVSSHAATSIASRSGSARRTPIGDRVTAVMPLKTDSRENFAHRSTSMLLAHPRRESRALARCFERDETLRSASVELAEDERVERGMTNDPWLADHRRDIGDTAGDMLAPDVCATISTASTPFCRVTTTVSGPIERVECSGGGLEVVHLDGEEDGVDRADRRGIVGRLDVRQVQVALRALEPQAARPAGRQDARRARRMRRQLLSACSRAPK